MNTPQKTLLVTGASGYLGRRLTRIAASQHRIYSAYGQNREQISAGEPVPLDITASDQVKRTLEQLKPHAVIHCAAANPGVPLAQMQTVNVDGSREVASHCASMGIRLVHVSTDMVHDGNQAPYADDATPTADNMPGNVYGQTKAAAESLIAKLNPDAVMVRTSLIYGLHEMDRGTAGFVAKLEANEPLMLFSDVVRQPVYIDSLIQALIKLATDATDCSGLLNVAGRQAIDRASFAQRMLEWWGIEYAGRLTTGPARDLDNPPPLDLRLNLDRAERVLGMHFPGVNEIVEVDAH